VGWVREENTLRLAGIYEPRDLVARFDVFLDELGFFGMASKLLFMALNTRIQFGNPREAAVLPEIVATLAFAHFFHMELVVKIDGLLLLGVQDLWEEYPAGEKVRPETYRKRNDGYQKSPVPGFWWLVLFLGMGLVFFSRSLSLSRSLRRSLCLSRSLFRGACLFLLLSYSLLFFLCCAHGNSKSLDLLV
jgi:di/tricarboxylate transporter